MDRFKDRHRQPYTYKDCLIYLYVTWEINRNAYRQIGG